MCNSEMLAFYALLLLITLVASLQADSVHYEDCGSKANVTELRVSGCSEPPCIFIKGKAYEVEIDAISSSTSTKLPYKVTAKVEMFPITILKGDACDVLSRGSCPVKIGDEFTYKNTIKVSPKYPSFHTKVKALVQDDHKNSVICVVIDVAIKSGQKKYRPWFHRNRKITSQRVNGDVAPTLA